MSLYQGGVFLVREKQKVGVPKYTYQPGISFTNFGTNCRGKANLIGGRAQLPESGC